MSDPANSGAAHPSGSRTHPVNIHPARLAGRPSVIDSIVDEIVDRIASGELKDGDMLASQDELARSLGVSRASLREALNRLNLLGLVESRHGSGTFVKTARPQHFMNSLSSMLVMDQSSAAELLEARLHVESALAALAALGASEEQICRMRMLVERMEFQFQRRDDDGFVAMDAQFHMLIAESSQNRVLWKVLEVIREILPQCIRRFHLTFPARVPTTLRYHRAIYEAIEKRDAGEARDHMEGHIRYLMQLNGEDSATALRVAP